MKNKFISDYILKSVLGDEHSFKLSTLLRKKRSGFKQILTNFFTKKLTDITKRNRETYDCKHTTDLPGTKVLQEQSPLSTDLVLNAAHVNSANVFAFYQQLFNRTSLDGQGMTISSSAHYSQNYNNAFWNGKEMVYGDGDGAFFKELTRGLDVCAHEMSHAVTQYTCNLAYMGQSGALNEAFSDIMGVACKHWVNKHFDPVTANWLMGDEIVGDKFPGKAIRSFKDEKAYDGDNQPKRFDKLVFTFSDNFGVHTNSGPKNHAFYLMCLAFNRPSYDKPAQIVYKAHTEYLKSWSNFKDAAKAEIRAAQELYGKEDAEIVRKVYQSLGMKI